MLTDLADDLRRYPDRLGVAMDLDREPAAGKGKGRSRKAPVATVRRPDDDEGRSDPPRVAVAAPGAAPAAPRDHRGGRVNAAEAGAI
jgi:hypothetical protein